MEQEKTTDKISSVTVGVDERNAESAVEEPVEPVGRRLTGKWILGSILGVLLVVVLWPELRVVWLVVARLFESLPTSGGEVNDWQFVPTGYGNYSIWRELQGAFYGLAVYWRLLFLVPAVLLAFFIKWLFGRKHSKWFILWFVFGVPIMTVFPILIALGVQISPFSVFSFGDLLAAVTQLAFLVYVVVFTGLVLWSSFKLIRTKDNKEIKNKAKSRLGLGALGLAQVIGVFLLFQIVEFFFGTTIAGRSNMSVQTYGGGGAGLYGNMAPMAGSPGMAARPFGGITNPGLESDSIGLSVGGAKDVNNFRENIKNNYLPLVTDITYEGLFYDYYFELGQSETCDQLFCPAYNLAYSPDPISGEANYYMSVGLNSNIKETDFQRKKLNLVVVLDISGSMSSGFNQYYYDRAEKPNETKSKMEVANESVVALLDHLQPGDRLGIVLFDDIAYLAKPMRLVEQTDIEGIKQGILDIGPQGGTNMSAGLETATDILQPYRLDNPEEYENRIIFLTDAQPNTGNYSRKGLLEFAQENAAQGIFTTFIGIGLDFNSDLIESITKVRGSNYYSVHSSEDFMYRMDAGFEYMVTPLVYDLELRLQSEDFEIEKVYGSLEADKATGQIMYVNTLFPSDSRDGEVRGGLILLKLKPKTENPSGSVSLMARYKNRSLEEFESSNQVLVDTAGEESYDHNGIRKGIVLARYAELLRHWMTDERKNSTDPSNVIRFYGDKESCDQATGMNCVYRSCEAPPEQVDGPENPVSVSVCGREGWVSPVNMDKLDDMTFTVNEELGIPAYPEFEELTEWERKSLPLTVSDHYRQMFSQFSGYMQEEREVLGDETMDQELELLGRLTN